MRFQRNQLGALWVGISLAIAVIIFPPWTTETKYSDWIRGEPSSRRETSSSRVRQAWPAFNESIFGDWSEFEHGVAPGQGGRSWVREGFYEIDYHRFALFLTIIALLTAGIIATLQYWPVFTLTKKGRNLLIAVAIVFGSLVGTVLAISG